MTGGNGSRKDKGGSAPRRKGDAFEVKVVADQERMGRVAFRARQGGGEIVDVAVMEAFNPGQPYLRGSRTWLIQCRVGGHMTALEREQLIERARVAGAEPQMAFPNKRTIEYVEVKKP